VRDGAAQVALVGFFTAAANVSVFVVDRASWSMGNCLPPVIGQVARLPALPTVDIARRKDANPADQTNDGADNAPHAHSE
jgi:hypothetical protein